MRRLLPGLALALAITATAFALKQLPGLNPFSPLIIAVVLGMVVRNTLGAPAWAAPGLAFAVRPVLRFGIVLLGLQLTLGQIVGMGGATILLLVLTVVLTYVFTAWLGRALGVNAKLTDLIAAGTSICGASAIVAANSAIRGRDEDMAYALAVVTLFGTVLMFSLPLAGQALAMGAHSYGVWAGAAVHEVPQVVAAAFARGQEAGEVGTVAKLTRVLMLAPMVLALGWWIARHGGSGAARAPFPWFVFGFLGMAALASSGWLPQLVYAPAKIAVQILLATALAAVGMATSLRSFVQQGWKPLALGAISTAFITGGTLAAIALLGL
jgi:uncharacterized integral membrane protein (TIGR00698 family)